MNLEHVFYSILDFIYSLVNFTYEAIFHQVTIGGNTFPLWQIFTFVGVGVFLLAMIIKILL